MPFSVRETQKQAEAVLQTAGIEEARLEVRWMLEALLGWTRTDLVLQADAWMPETQALKLTAWLERRLRHEPLQYILGEAGFYGQLFRVTPDVLIPRPETEALVTEILARSPASVLDIGTGSGCIPISVQKSLTTAQVWGCDVSKAALEVAQENAKNLGAEVGFFQADVLSEAFVAEVQQKAQGSWELIVSNPPYILPEEALDMQPEVRDFEPALALFTNGDPLQFYTAIAKHAQHLLCTQGFLLFECHKDYAAAVQTLLETMSYEAIELKKDWAGLPRVVIAKKT